MALTHGTRLGPYEIGALLGVGGMGEVYRARDTRLARTVAIKVLPSVVAGDPDVRSRFEREARAVAALDHPHICGIYDVGSVGGTHYLVMPHLDGQTLAARLEKGSLPLDQALKIAVEIADALDKAHRLGITHRDVKPANIMLTKTGSKLLDFGLAKLKAPTGPISMSAVEALATSMPGTAHGTILGTMLYMAPEQVEGKEADARSDIWALGAVIYEMTTGTRPFTGDTPASVSGAVLKDTPPSISTRQPLAPRALNYVAERCFAKNPDERWQSIGDIGRMLEWIAANQAADADRHARPRAARKERTAWIAATTLLLIALAFAAAWRRPIAPTGDAVRLSLNPPERMVFAPHNSATVPTPQFAVSPDGRSIAFVALGSGIRPAVWLRPMQEVNARLVQGTEDAQEPFWSPDSQWIGFLAGEGTLKRVPVSGGTVQTIARGLADFRGASWGLLSAQQRDGNLNVPHIGYLGFRPLTESVSIEIVAALNEGLRNLGHAEGRDYILDLRSADDDADRFPALVAELTRLQVKLIFAPSTPAAVAIHKANPAMPIVVRGPDIVGAGLAQSASRPGGMVTGIDEVGTGDTTKRLRLLKQAVPAMSRVAILGSAPSEAGHVRAIAEAEQAAKTIAVTLKVFRVSATTDLDPIFAGLRSDRVDAILCSGGILPRPVEQRIVELAARHRLPAMYPAIDYVQLGGLLSYGYRNTEMIRAAATYVDRLLKGANPGDLPLTIWDRYYLTVNAKAAAALGLALPTTLLAQADEVIK